MKLRRRGRVATEGIDQRVERLARPRGLLGARGQVELDALTRAFPALRVERFVVMAIGPHRANIPRPQPQDV